MKTWYFQNPQIISTDEVQVAVRLGKKGKAASGDGIIYAHVEFGGEMLPSLLAKLFTAMLKQS